MNPGNGSSIFLIVIIINLIIIKYFVENIHLLIFFKYFIQVLNWGSLKPS